jgi:hypothetical protein
MTRASWLKSGSDFERIFARGKILKSENFILTTPIKDIHRESVSEFAWVNRSDLQLKRNRSEKTDPGDNQEFGFHT